MIIRRLTKSERQASWVSQRIQWLEKRFKSLTITVKPKGLPSKEFPLAYFFDWSLPYFLVTGETARYIKPYTRERTSWGV